MVSKEFSLRIKLLPERKMNRVVCPKKDLCDLDFETVATIASLIYGSSCKLGSNVFNQNMPSEIIIKYDNGKDILVKRESDGNICVSLRSDEDKNKENN